jgi:hypothetical protein
VGATFVRRILLATLSLLFAPAALDSPRSARAVPVEDAEPAEACEGLRPPLPDALTFELRSGAFPGSGHPDVAVHVPPGFDGTRRPGVILYFHGWNGCVGAALADQDTPCTDEGDPRTASGLAAQIDEARVNALLVAVELRVDLPTGEPGQLAMPGDLRELLRELFTEHLDEQLGCALDVDALDRVVLVAHSGGYQAAASALRYGDLPGITEVDLLDAFYGAEDVFADWVTHALDDGLDRGLRFVDLYTAGGGTLERSRALANLAQRSARGFEGVLTDDDGDREPSERQLARPIVFKRVPQQHSELPRAYVGSLVRAAGFAPLRNNYK